MAKPNEEKKDAERDEMDCDVEESTNTKVMSKEECQTTLEVTQDLASVDNNVLDKKQVATNTDSSEVTILKEVSSFICMLKHENIVYLCFVNPM